MYIFKWLVLNPDCNLTYKMNVKAFQNNYLLNNCVDFVAISFGLSLVYFIEFVNIFLDFVN